MIWNTFKIMVVAAICSIIIAVIFTPIVVWLVFCVAKIIDILINLSGG